MRRSVAEFFTDEVHVNEHGGKQSRVASRLDLVDPYAMLALGRVLAKGVHYGVDNWRAIPARDHANHALNHLMGYLAGDPSDPHLEHAFCRLMMAVAMEGQETTPKVAA